MDKLNTFQQNDAVRLFRLAKTLHENNFFVMFLNDVQLKILGHVISKNNDEVWSNFINGNCFLKYAQDSENQSEELIESGSKAIKMLALHVRYLLWEKAIDYYYNAKAMDESSQKIMEQGDSYDLIEEINKENEDSAAVPEDTSKEAKSTIRDEEDDYDDDEEDEEGGESGTKSVTENGDTGEDQAHIEYNDENMMVLEIPTSIFEEEANQEQESTNMSNSEIDPSTSSRTLEEQENLIREFNKVYHNFEYDRETLIKRRKLEQSDMQLEQSSSQNDTNESQKNNMEINLGAASTSLQHLLSTIQENRESVPLNDFELRNLFMDVRKNRGKWASDERVGQEELYEACEKVVLELRGYTEHSTPFLNKVSKREAPNYGLIIKKPMDLNTTMKKLKNLSYNSKQEFVDDLMLIWSNCLTYNADPKHFLRAHAIAMQKKTLKLIPRIPDITIRSRAEVEKEEEALESETKSGTPVAGKTSKKGRKRTREDQLKGEDDVKESSEDITDSNSHQATPATETSFNNVSNKSNQDGETDIKKVSETSASIGAELDEEEEEEEEKLGSSANNIDEVEDELHPEIQAWKTLTAKSRANYCAQRANLFNPDNTLRFEAPAIIRRSKQMANFNTYLNNKEVVSKSNNLLENDEPYLLEYDITGGLPRLKYTGITDEDEDRKEQELVDKILANNDYGKSGFALSTDSGLNKVYLENITEIQEIRKICFKISLIRQMQTQQFVHHTQMKQQEIEELKEVDIDSISKLENHDPFNDQVQYSALRRNIAKIAMQTGFESTDSFAINTLTQVAERYIGNLTKSIKLHTETASSNKLSTRDIILLSLLENGIDKPDDLYTFVQEKIVKQQEKLKDLRSKLSNFLKELLRPGLENFNEKSFTDSSEQFITGDFSNGLGDDFFGFKELGLDKEFNLLSSSIPVYLLHSRLHNSFTDTSNVSKLQKYKDLTDYVPATLKACDIDAQIGLLKPFYQKLYDKSKTHYIKNQKKKGESTEIPPNNQLLLIEDEELPQKQRNTRPRLPPTGKITAIKKKVVANSFFIPDDPVKDEP